MTNLESRKLKIGVYKIYWKSGGHSVAAVGVKRDGNKWLAPLNWVGPTNDAKIWKSISKVELMRLDK